MAFMAFVFDLALDLGMRSSWFVDRRGNGGPLAYELIDGPLKLFVRSRAGDSGRMARDPEVVNGTVSSSSA
jgi:hypothetical protein